MTMKSIVTSLLPVTAALLLATACDRPVTAQEPAAGQEASLSPLEEAVVRESEATVKAFNAGDAAALGGMFLETGELVDEAGNVHTGKAAILLLALRHEVERVRSERRPLSVPLADVHAGEQLTCSSDELARHGRVEPRPPLRRSKELACRSNVAHAVTFFAASMSFRAALRRLSRIFTFGSVI